MAVQGVTLQGFLPQIGIYTVLSFILTLLYLHSVRGKIQRIPGQLASHQWSILTTQKQQRCISKCLLGFIIFFLISPVISLIIWGSIVSYTTDKNNSEVTENTEPLITPIAIFLIGLSSFAFFLGILNTMWKKYRFTTCSIFLTLCGLIFLIAFQVVSIFLDEPITYFGVSSIFLAGNGLFVILIVFINSDTGGRSIQDVIQTLPDTADAVSMIQQQAKQQPLQEIKERSQEDNPQGGSEEVQEDLQSQDYQITKQEVGELFTLHNVRLKGGMASSFGGGIQKLFSSMSKRKLFFFSFLFYLISIAMLVGYTFIINEYTEQGRLGGLNSISLVVIDILIGLYFHSGIVQQPAYVAMMVVLFRALTFVFGGKYWYLGYSLLFMIFAIVIAWAISKKYYPFSQDYEDKYSIAQAQQKQYNATGNKTDVSKSPEFLYILQIILFAGLTIIVEWVQPKGVPRPRIQIVNGADFAYYWFGIFAMLLSGFILLGFFMLRILMRQKMKLFPVKNFYLFFSWFKPYWIYALISYAVALIGGYILWLLLDESWTAFALCAFIPPLLLLILNAYTHYVSNDYRVLQNVGRQNRLRQREHDKRKAALRKARDMKEDMMRGTLSQFGKLKTISPSPDDDLQGTFKSSKKAFPQDELSQEFRKQEQKKSIQQLPQSPPESPKLKQGKTFNKLVQLAQDKDIQLVLEVEQFKQIPDWRKEKISCCTAFCRGRLRPSDYNIIVSLFLFFILNLIMGLAISFIRSTWAGMSLSMALFAYYFAFSTLIRVLATDAKIGCIQITSLIFAYLIVYVYGVIFFISNLDGDKDKHADFIIGFMIVLPMTFSLLTGIYKWYDNKWKLDAFVISMLVLTYLYFIALVILVWWLTTLTAGIVLLIIGILVTYVAISLSCYIKNNFYMPKGFEITNYILLGLVVLLALVLSIVLDNFNKFVGFSISYGVLVVILLCLGADDLVGDLLAIQEKPLFFSPWVFPIYQYDPKKDRVKTRNTGTLLIYAAFFLALAWSIICTVWVKPLYIGVSVCSLCELLIVIFTLYLSSFSPLQLKAAWPFIDLQTRKKAWIEAKKTYVTGRNAFSMMDLVTFKDLNDRTNMIKKHIKALKRHGNRQFIMEELPENAPEDTKLESVLSMMKYLFMNQEDANQVYLEEINLIVHFQLLLIIFSQSVQLSARQKLFKFLGNKSTVLLANGVDIKWKMKTSDSVRFARVMNQIEKLPAEKRVLFKKMRQNYQAQEYHKAQLDIEREQKEEQAQKERQERRRQKKLLLQAAEVPQDVPINDLPDSFGKWQRILKEHSNDNKFTDEQFKPNEESLGPNVEGRIYEWQRADDTWVLYKNQIDCFDVVQGALGDCYFLSAMGVLGEKYVKNVMISLPQNKVGAYCVKFFDSNGDAQYVIVDDYIPMDREGQPAFVKSNDQGELWPVIIEKAYAKMNGNYQNIQAGKVQFALADLTGGVPQEMRLAKVENKLSAFWKKILQYYSHGYFMGAGTPEHELGDRAINDLGIVQGHAYSILDVKQVDSNKLIRLRNPHGHKGVEWQGDWGDNSDKWTDRIKNRVHYVDQEDGAFWMSVNDFIDQFKNIYICRKFEKPKWTVDQLKGEWKGESAAGLPSRANPKCCLSKNPHFGIRVGKPCTLFIQVTQSETVDTFKGKLPIMFLLMKEKGKRIQKLKRDNIIGQSGNPTNLKTITAEIQLDKSVSYPYTYTLMVASAYGGEKGESEFDLKIYCDSGCTVKELPEE